MAKELLTVRCPDDLTQLIQEQIEVTGLDKTTVVINMLRQSFPCVPFKERDKLPSISAIYLVFASNNLLYVGRSSNLKHRWQTHHRLHQFKLIEGLQIAWFECHTDNLPAVESTLIDLLDPSYNGTYNEWSNEKSKVISYRLDDELVERLKDKALPGETVHQTAQRLVRETLGTSTPLVEVAPTSTANLEERIDSVLEEKLSIFAANQNDLLSRIQERIQQLESSLEAISAVPESVPQTIEPDTVLNTVQEEDEPVVDGTNKSVDSGDRVLTQGELAKRLGIHTGTLTKNRAKSNFAEWTRAKDPEQLAWQYLTEVERYYPLPKVSTAIDIDEDLVGDRWKARVDEVIASL